MITPILQHLYAIGVGASVVLGLFLAVVFSRQKRENRKTNLLLSALMVVLSLSVATHAFLDRFIPGAYPRIWTFPEPFLLLVGPLFYYYIQSLAASFTFVKKTWLHSVPFVVVALCFILFVSLDAQSLARVGDLWHMIGLLWLAVHIQFWIYYFLNRTALNRLRERLKQSHSSIEKINQEWIAYCLTALLVCYTILSILFLLGHGRILLPINQTLAIVLALIIYSVGYRTLTQPEIFMGDRQATLADHEAGTGEKYKKSGLSEDAARAELAKIETFMAREKPHLDPDLDLQGLANRLQLSSHHLSQVINNGSQTHFYDFVNTYRVQEAKALLTNPDNDHLTILSLAFEAGFNSKATFNRFFKKVTQQTPSQFRQAHRKSGLSRLS